MLVNAAGLPVTSSAKLPEKSTQTVSADTGIATSHGGYITDANQQNFMQRVIEASRDRPVLVDFWAPWCEPCKQYAPILEQVIGEEKGRVFLVKVDVDENPALAQQLHIRSMPTTMIFVQGRPIEAIPGVLDAPTLRKIIAQVLKMTGKGSNAEHIAALLEEAQQILATDPAEALERFLAIVAEQPDHTAAVAGVLRAFVALKQTAEAEQFYAALDETLQQHNHVQEAYLALQLADNSQDSEALQQAWTAHEQNPDDLNARFVLAEQLIGAAQHQPAIEQLLAIIAHEREWQDKKARQHLLDLFAALGFQHPLSKQGRQKLASILFQ